MTTRAAEGILVRQADAEPISVIAVPETKPVEPTGGGDALRAGFIAGRMWGLSLERATQLGSAVATAAVEVIGTQEYDLPKESFLGRFAEAFGQAAADEVAPHLPGSVFCRRTTRPGAVPLLRRVRVFPPGTLGPHDGSTACAGPAPEPFPRWDQRVRVPGGDPSGPATDPRACAQALDPLGSPISVSPAR